MSYIGDIRLEDTFDKKFCTVTTTGAPTVLAGSPVISAYVGNSTTQITAGITLTVDFDGVVGLNNVRVVATAANGYTAASDVDLVITTGTIGGTSAVGYVPVSFSIEKRSALRPTVAARTLDVSAGGEAGVDWANVGSPTTAVNLSGTNIDTDQVVASVAGAVGSVGTGGIAAASFAAGAIDAAALAADAIDEIWDEQVGDGTLTSRQAMRVYLAALAGKLSGAATTTVTIRNVADTANVIGATVDGDGNRSATSVTP